MKKLTTYLLLISMIFTNSKDFIHKTKINGHCIKQSMQYTARNSKQSHIKKPVIENIALQSHIEIYSRLREIIDTVPENILYKALNFYKISMIYKNTSEESLLQRAFSELIDTIINIEDYDITQRMNLISKILGVVQSNVLTDCMFAQSFSGNYIRFSMNQFILDVISDPFVNFEQKLLVFKQENQIDNDLSEMKRKTDQVIRFLKNVINTQSKTYEVDIVNSFTEMFLELISLVQDKNIRRDGFRESLEIFFNLFHNITNDFNFEIEELDTGNLNVVINFREMRAMILINFSAQGKIISTSQNVMFEFDEVTDLSEDLITCFVRTGGSISPLEFLRIKEEFDQIGREVLTSEQVIVGNEIGNRMIDLKSRFYTKFLQMKAIIPGFDFSIENSRRGPIICNVTYKGRTWTNLYKLVDNQFDQTFQYKLLSWEVPSFFETNDGISLELRTVEKEESFLMHCLKTSFYNQGTTFFEDSNTIKREYKRGLFRILRQTVEEYNSILESIEDPTKERREELFRNLLYRNFYKYLINHRRSPLNTDEIKLEIIFTLLNNLLPQKARYLYDQIKRNDVIKKGLIKTFFGEDTRRRRIASRGRRNKGVLESLWNIALDPRVENLIDMKLVEKTRIGLDSFFVSLSLGRAQKYKKYLRLISEYSDNKKITRKILKKLFIEKHFDRQDKTKFQRHLPLLLLHYYLDPKNYDAYYEVARNLPYPELETEYVFLWLDIILEIHFENLPRQTRGRHLTKKHIRDCFFEILRIMRVTLNEDNQALIARELRDKRVPIERFLQRVQYELCVALRSLKTEDRLVLASDTIIRRNVIRQFNQDVLIGREPRVLHTEFFDNLMLLTIDAITEGAINDFKYYISISQYRAIDTIIIDFNNCGIATRGGMELFLKYINSIPRDKNIIILYYPDISTLGIVLINELKQLLVNAILLEGNQRYDGKLAQNEALNSQYALVLDQCYSDVEMQESVNLVPDLTWLELKELGLNDAVSLVKQRREIERLTLQRRLIEADLIMEENKRRDREREERRERNERLEAEKRQRREELSQQRQDEEILLLEAEIAERTQERDGILEEFRNSVRERLSRRLERKRRRERRQARKVGLEELRRKKELRAQRREQRERRMQENKRRQEQAAELQRLRERANRIREEKARLAEEERLERLRQAELRRKREKRRRRELKAKRRREKALRIRAKRFRLLKQIKESFDKLDVVFSKLGVQILDRSENKLDQRIEDSESYKRSIVRIEEGKRLAQKFAVIEDLKRELWQFEGYRRLNIRINSVTQNEEPDWEFDYENYTVTINERDIEFLAMLRERCYYGYDKYYYVLKSILFYAHKIHTYKLTGSAPPLDVRMMGKATSFFKAVYCLYTLKKIKETNLKQVKILEETIEFINNFVKDLTDLREFNIVDYIEEEFRVNTDLSEINSRRCHVFLGDEDNLEDIIREVELEEVNMDLYVFSGRNLKLEERQYLIERLGIESESIVENYGRSEYLKTNVCIVTKLRSGLEYKEEIGEELELLTGLDMDIKLFDAMYERNQENLILKFLKYMRDTLEIDRFKTEFLNPITHARSRKKAIKIIETIKILAIELGIEGIDLERLDNLEDIKRFKNFRLAA